MTITNFNRLTLDELRRKLDAAAKLVGDNLGIKIAVGGIKFTPTNCTIKLEAAVIDTTGAVAVVRTREVEDFAAFCGMFSLRTDDLGKDFVFRGCLYRITGLKPSAPKFPVIAERVHDKKGFKFPAHAVLVGLGRPPSPAGRLPWSTAA